MTIEPTYTPEELEEAKSLVPSRVLAEAHPQVIERVPNWVRVLLVLLSAGILAIGVVLTLTIQVVSRQEVQSSATTERNACDGAYTTQISETNLTRTDLGELRGDITLRGLLVFLPPEITAGIDPSVATFDPDDIVKLLEDSDIARRNSTAALVARTNWRQAGYPLPCPIAAPNIDN